MTTQDAIRILQRLAQGVENLSPPPPPENEIKSSDAYMWDAARKVLVPVIQPHVVDLALLKGIDSARDALLANTLQFSRGHSANNALLWGARGMGKSALVKAVWAQVNKQAPRSLVLVEVRGEELGSLPKLIEVLRGWVIRRFVIFCDDADTAAPGHAALASVLEGGIEARPDHLLFYAASAGPPQDAADRFGLWLEFPACDESTYLAISQAWAVRARLEISTAELHEKALAWAATRGTRSGRVAWQFIQDLAGKMGKRISS